jgi:integrase
MSVHQGRGGDGLYRKRGIWYFRPPAWNGIARPTSTRTRNLADARAYRAHYLETLVVGSNTHTAERMLVRQATAERLEMACSPKRRTRFTHISSMKNIDRLIGELPLGSFAIDTMRRYQLQRSKEGAAAGTINNETIIIKSILTEKKLWARLGDGYKPLKANTKVGRNWTMEEVEAVLTTAAGGQRPWYLLPVLQLDFETGLRHTEIRSLRRRSFDFSRHTITVERSTTKTKAGDRTVPMNRTAEYIARQILGKAEQLGSTRPEHFVFAGRTKTGPRQLDPTRPFHTFHNAYVALRRDAGVDSSLRFHDIRHHVTSDLAESDLSSAVACRILGWTSVNMRRHYEHLRASASDHAMDHLEEVRRKADRVITPLPTVSYEGSFQDGAGI